MKIKRDPKYLQTGYRPTVKDNQVCFALLGPGFKDRTSDYTYIWCRESVAYRITRKTHRYGMCLASDKDPADGIAMFTAIEHILGIQPSTFIVGGKNKDDTCKLYAVEPSPFWRSCRPKFELLTLFMRLCWGYAPKGTSKKITEKNADRRIFEAINKYTLANGITSSLTAFLAGRTDLVMYERGNTTLGEGDLIDYMRYYAARPIESKEIKKDRKFKHNDTVWFLQEPKTKPKDQYV